MAFSDYWSELLGWVPELDSLLAQKLVNRAWSDIREVRFWSWLRGVGVLLAPQVITSGSVTVVQFSATVTLDATANAALNSLTNPLIGQRQFRAGMGPVYNIFTYDHTASTITLDRPYMEVSAAAQPYQVYRCYYTPTDKSGNLTTDFSKWKVIVNPVDGYAIVGGSLNITRAELDARDPTRGAQDLAYCLASYDVDASGNPRYELWPHPTAQRGYVTLYQKRGLDLSDTADVPNTLPSKLVVELALSYAYDWAAVNVGRFPVLKGVDWRLRQAESQRKYEKMLLDARRKDDELMLDSYIPNLRDYMGFPPIDSKFFQSHDVGGWFQD